MFQVLLGMSREQMLELSIPEMVDMVDYYMEVKGNG